MLSKLDSPSAEASWAQAGSQGEAPGAATAPTHRHGPILAALCADELRQRHPRIQQAGAAGDLPAIRAEAHALRGVAANFGLGALAGQLLALEAAAGAGDRPGLGMALRRLPMEVARAMQALGHDEA